MKQRLFILSILLVSNVAFGLEAISPSAVYYVGEQENFLGGADECFVEADYSSDGSEVVIRSILIDAHEDVLVGVESIKALYSVVDGAYVYLSLSEDDDILFAELISKQVKSGEMLSLTLNDGGHTDSLSCDKLVRATDVKLDQVKEMFQDFEAYEEEHHEVAGDDEHDNEDSKDDHSHDHD